jgi:hypothetical protein
MSCGYDEILKNYSKLAQTKLVFLPVISVMNHLSKEPSQNDLHIQKLNIKHKYRLQDFNSGHYRCQMYTL